MDIEQLKMVLDVAQATTDTAAWLVGAWLVAAYVLPWVGGVVMVYMVAKLIIRAMNTGIDTSDVRALRDRLHIGCPGHVTPGEFRSTIRHALVACDERDQLRNRVCELEARLRNTGAS